MGGLNTDNDTIASITPEASRQYDAVSILAILAKGILSTPIGTIVLQVAQKLTTAARPPLLASSLQVWYDALKVLAVLGDQGNVKALDAMISRLEHEEEWLRCGATLSLSETSLEFNEVMEHMDHP